MSQLLSPEEQKRLVDGLLKEASALSNRVGTAFYERMLDLTGTRYSGSSYLKDALNAGMHMAFLGGRGHGDSPFKRFLDGVREDIRAAVGK